MKHSYTQHCCTAPPTLVFRFEPHVLRGDQVRKIDQLIFAKECDNANSTTPFRKPNRGTPKRTELRLNLATDGRKVNRIRFRRFRKCLFNRIFNKPRTWESIWCHRRRTRPSWTILKLKFEERFWTTLVAASFLRDYSDSNRMWVTMLEATKGKTRDCTMFTLLAPWFDIWAFLSANTAIHLATETMGALHFFRCE